MSTNGTKSDDDADLDDLLTNTDGGAKSAVERQPLNLNDLSEGKLDVHPRPHNRRPNANPGICDFIQAHISYLCFRYPMICGCFFCVISFVLLTMLVTSFANPTKEFGVIQNDWTNVQSQYDMDLGKIDHWCLKGDNDSCRCEDPLVPASRVELRSWVEALKDNKKQVKSYMPEINPPTALDVAILGESAIEEMDGRWMGRRPTDELKTIGEHFHARFKKSKGGPVEGVALGIAGDSANNVLWRLRHGEMPTGFEPKIWWVSLGMNDLTRMQCSEEVVVLGVLRVVEEILNTKPNARVVINSLLPMADLRGGPTVTDTDYKDAFTKYRGHKKAPMSHYVRKENNGKETFHRAQPIIGKRPKRDEGADRRTTRQLLESALDSFSSSTLDNDLDNEIDELQRQLETEFDYSESYDMAHDLEMERDRRLRDRYNPTIDRDQHTQKKYGFFRERKLPLWTSIYAVNEQLFKFCEKHHRVDFFDATNVFAERRDDTRTRHRTFILLSEMISARGHPTEVGYVRWEDGIVKRTLEILEEMRKEQPELFLNDNANTATGNGDGASQKEGADAGGGDDDDVGDNIGTTGNKPGADSSHLEKKPKVNDDHGDEDGLAEKGAGSGSVAGAVGGTAAGGAPASGATGTTAGTAPGSSGPGSGGQSVGSIGGGTGDGSGMGAVGGSGTARPPQGSSGLGAQGGQGGQMQGGGQGGQMVGSGQGSQMRGAGQGMLGGQGGQMQGGGQGMRGGQGGQMQGGAQGGPMQGAGQGMPLQGGTGSLIQQQQGYQRPQQGFQPQQGLPQGGQTQGAELGGGLMTNQQGAPMQNVQDGGGSFIGPGGNAQGGNGMPMQQQQPAGGFRQQPQGGAPMQPGLQQRPQGAGGLPMRQQPGLQQQPQGGGGAPMRLQPGIQPQQGFQQRGQFQGAGPTGGGAGFQQSGMQGGGSAMAGSGQVGLQQQQPIQQQQGGLPAQQSGGGMQQAAGDGDDDTV